MALEVRPSGQRDWGKIVSDAISAGIGGYQQGMSLRAARDLMEYQQQARALELQKQQQSIEAAAIEAENERNASVAWNDAITQARQGIYQPFQLRRNIGGMTMTLPSSGDVAAQQSLAQYREAAAGRTNGVPADDLMAAGYSKEEIEANFQPTGTYRNPTTGQEVVLYRRPNTRSGEQRAQGTYEARQRLAALDEVMRRLQGTAIEGRILAQNMENMERAYSNRAVYDDATMAQAAPAYVREDGTFDRETFARDVEQQRGVLALGNPAIVLQAANYLRALNNGVLPQQYSWMADLQTANDRNATDYVERVATMSRLADTLKNYGQVVSQHSTQNARLYNFLQAQNGYLGANDAEQANAAAQYARDYNTTPDEVRRIAAGIRYAATAGQDETARRELEMYRQKQEIANTFTMARDAARAARTAATRAAAPVSAGTANRAQIPAEYIAPANEAIALVDGFYNTVAKVKQYQEENAGAALTLSQQQVLAAWNNLPASRQQDIKAVAEKLRNNAVLSREEYNTLLTAYGAMTSAVSRHASFLMADQWPSLAALPANEVVAGAAPMSGAPPAPPAPPAAPAPAAAAPPQQAAQPARPPRQARVATRGSDLNIRSGAGTNNSVIGSIPNNTTVTVIDMGNGWAKVVYHGKQGYISTDYLR